MTQRRDRKKAKEKAQKDEADKSSQRNSCLCPSLEPQCVTTSITIIQ